MSSASSSRSLCIAAGKNALFLRSNSLPLAQPPQLVKPRRHSYTAHRISPLASDNTRRRLCPSGAPPSKNHNNRRHSVASAVMEAEILNEASLKNSASTQAAASGCPFTALKSTVSMSASKWFGQPKTLKNPTFIPGDHSPSAALLQASAIFPEHSEANTANEREIPSSKGYPFVGTLFDFVGKRAKFQFPKFYEAHLARFAEHGPIYRETICGNTMIMLSDVDEWVKKIINQEPRYPERISLEPISRYRNKHNLFIGTSNAVGPEWLGVRKAVNSVAQTPASSRAYHQPLAEVARDFVERLARIRGPDGIIESFEDETYKWQLESIFSIFFNDRLGCLNAQLNTELAHFVRSARRFFANLQKLMWQPPFMRHIRTQQWREFEVDSTALHQMCFSAIQRKNMCPVNSLLGRLMQHTNKIGYERMKIAATDLLIGSQESAVKSVQWFLYALACSPDAQSKLQREVDAVAGQGDITLDMLDNKMPYMRACWWETLRMFPPGIGTVRVMPSDKDICGYRVRKGQVVMLSSWAVARNSELFPEPETFRPERWLEGNQTEHQHLYKQIPFGSGRRMCVGKRIAEQEIFLLATEIFRRFNVAYAGGSKLVPLVETFLTTNRPLLLSFQDRTSTSSCLYNNAQQNQ